MTIEFTKGVSTRVNDEMFEEIQILANQEHRSMSNLVRVLITEALHLRKAGISQFLFPQLQKHGFQEVTKALINIEGEENAYFPGQQFSLPPGKPEK